MSTQRVSSTVIEPAGPVAPHDAPLQAGSQGRTSGTAPVPPSETQGTQTYQDTDRRQSAGEYEGGENRRTGVDRRAGVDRRLIDMGTPTGLERRRGPGRRRTDDRRSAEEGEMSDEQFEFVLAVDTYKRLNNRPFPTWTEILEVVKQLGYRKVAASTLNLTGAVSRSSTQSSPAPAPSAAPAPESDYLPG